MRRTINNEEHFFSDLRNLPDHCVNIISTVIQILCEGLSISDLLSLGQGSVLELHRLVGEDLDVFVNGKLVARGEVVVYKEKFGARITEIISPTDRVKRMAGMDRYR